MRFLNPAGLWLLLGVPVLIVLYLIRAQHENRSVSSTFIWKLSSRFMKKRLPVQRIRKILTFLLQLLIIVSAAFLAARPAIVTEKSCDYIAIIDSSASMQTVDSTGTSRFAYALEAVEKLSKKAEKGHTVSVMIAGDSPAWLIKKSTAAKDVKLALENAQCSIGVCDTQQALSLATQLCQDSLNPQILFYTDNVYEEIKNVQIIDMNKNEWNVSVDNVASQPALMGMTFTADLISYNQDAFVTAGLRVDGIVSDIVKIRCQKDTTTTVTFHTEEITSYESAEVYLDIADGLQADNLYAVCKQRERTCNVALVSQSPLYLRSALNALGNCKVTVYSSADEKPLAGYDLYVFDQVAPKSFPKDGSVLVFGTQLLPEGLQISDAQEKQVALQTNSSVESPLHEGLSLKDVIIAKYTPLRGNLSWQEVFYCGNDPVVVTKDMGDGTQFTVASFDLHDSNLPMQTDYLVLMKNLVEFSVPSFLRHTDHIAGVPVTLTVKPNAQKLYVEYPDGNVRTLPTDFNTATVSTDQIGIYTAVMTADQADEYVDFFVHTHKEESLKNRYPTLIVELYITQEVVPEDAINEVWFWLALALFLLILTEWGWYYREQY